MIAAGNPLAFTVTFTDNSGTPTDPASGITIKVIDPNGTQTSYSYPAQITQLSQGVYQVTVAATLAGTWYGQGHGVLLNGMPVTSEDVAIPLDGSRFS